MFIVYLEDASAKDHARQAISNLSKLIFKFVTNNLYNIINNIIASFFFNLKSEML